MRAVYYERTGPAAEVLRVGELPTPTPAAGEVRVKLAASAVHPADTNRRAGRGYQMEGPLIVPHSDGAGVIDAVGPGVLPALIGERVWLYNGQRGGRILGTAAEYICIDQDLTAPLPAGVSFRDGACLGIPCMTAHRCLFADGSVAGKTVLVSGGAGAVANYAIQLAKWAGATVIATASAAGAEDALTAGADVVFKSRDEDLCANVLRETAGQGVDLAVEVDFGGNLRDLARIVRTNGSIAAYASRGDPNPAFPFYELMRRNIVVRPVLLPTCPLAARRSAQADIVRWLEQGPRFHRHVSMGLPETAKAHELVESGMKRGTVLVEP